MLAFVADLDRCVNWLECELGLKFTGPVCAYGFTDDNHGLVAAVVFSDYTRSNIHINLAGRAALTRFALRVHANAAFEVYGCKRLTALTNPGSDMTLLMQRLGFQYEGRMRRYYPGGEDAIVWGMLKAECHWF